MKHIFQKSNTIQFLRIFTSIQKTNFSYICKRKKTHIMFGIGGSEILFIILIAIMLFGADKIPEIARTLGKGMNQLKNATEDIKSEITNSAKENGLDVKSLTGGLNQEITEVKQSFNKIVDNASIEDPLDLKSITQDINSEITQVKTDIDDLPEGPIKRQL